jgi:hypothetical protein
VPPQLILSLEKVAAGHTGAVAAAAIEALIMLALRAGSTLAALAAADAAVSSRAAGSTLSVEVADALSTLRHATVGVDDAVLDPFPSPRRPLKAPRPLRVLSAPRLLATEAPPEEQNVYSPYTFCSCSIRLSAEGGAASGAGDRPVFAIVAGALTHGRHYFELSRVSNTKGTLLGVLSANGAHGVSTAQQAGPGARLPEGMAAYAAALSGAMDANKEGCQGKQGGSKDAKGWAASVLAEDGAYTCCDGTLPKKARENPFSAPSLNLP